MASDFLLFIIKCSNLFSPKYYTILHTVYFSCGHFQEVKKKIKIQQILCYETQKVPFST
jgi:hypothetical protein